MGYRALHNEQGVAQKMEGEDRAVQGRAGPGAPSEGASTQQTQQLLSNAGQLPNSKFDSLWIPSHLIIPVVQLAWSQGPFPTLV